MNTLPSAWTPPRELGQHLWGLAILGQVAWDVGMMKASILPTPWGKAVTHPAEDIAVVRIEETRRTGATKLDLRHLSLSVVPASLRGLTDLKALDLSGNGLSVLPEWLGELTGLQELSLRSNGLSVIPEWVRGLTGLEKLDVSGNGLSVVPESLGELTSLRSLGLAHNRLLLVPEWVRGLTDLEKLDMSGNELSVVPEWCGELTKLKHLALAHNRLLMVPEWIRWLRELKVLDVSGNDFPELPEWLGELTNLEALSLGTNGLSVVPGWVRGLTELKKLDVSGNGLSVVPEWLGELTNLKILALAHNRLSIVPEWIRWLTELVVLNMSGNEFPELPEWLGQLTDIKVLGLAHNRLSVVPEWIHSLTKLMVLEISGNELKELPDWLGQLTTLQEIDASENELSALPGSIDQLSDLQRLSLANNKLGVAPESLRGLTKLKNLDLSGNGLSVLPEWLGDLTALQILRLGNNALSALPKSIDRLSDLQTLYLGNNRFSVLPEWLSQLTKLRSLTLSKNKLSELPAWIGQLNRLKNLTLSNTGLSTLPEWLGQLTGLKSLRLNGNGLSTLPEWIGQLTSLNSLGLSGNKLSALPESIGQLTGLQFLDVDNNRLSTVPESLGHHTDLWYLSLSGNELSALPESIGQLTGLQALYLSGNELSALPESIGQLTALRTLSLANNRLGMVPESIGQLTSLQSLNLDNNELSVLPESIGQLTGIIDISVAGNTLTSPPPEVVEAGTASMVAFLAGVAEDPVQQWASKVLVVGQGRAGKTSLLKALRGEAFDAAEDSTHGLQVSSMDMTHPERAEVKMELAAWDFGGQEIYHATHQFFMTDRSLFLLLWDAQVGWEPSRLPYWLDMIKARAPKAPVVLVATHLGPRPPDLPLNDLKHAYPGLIVESLAVDSETGQGVEELRAIIARGAAGLPLMGTTWPRRWLRAADAIRARPENHIPTDRLFQAMCQEGVDDPVQQKALAVALHSLGDILCYPEEDELRDLVVLRPQWLTAYVSRVLDDPSEVVRANSGVFTREHQRVLWHDLDPGMRQHFVSMMERFDLSYRTSDQAGSLVVELLPWDPPDYAKVWEAASASHRELRLRYRLNTVPPGIPTWFIAREHRFTVGLHWRTGVLLRHTDGAHVGLVTMDRHTQTAEIRVRGPYPQDFFAILKDGFEETLERYPGLSYTRLVPCPNQLSDRTPCPHEFPHEQLMARILLNPPKEQVECPVDFEFLDVRQLLQGIEPPSPGYSQELALVAGELAKNLTVQAARQNQDVLAQLREQNQDVLAQLREVRIRQEAIASEQQRTFLASMRLEQSWRQVLCPSVVTVEAVGRRALGVGSVVRLHLYCEAPGAWHRAPGASPYEVKLTAEWATAVLPYAKKLLTVLRCVVPVVHAAIGIASEELERRLKSDIELMEAIVEGPPEELHASGGLGGVRSMTLATEDPQFRAMQHLLLQLDPQQAWGGLSKVPTPEGHVYWMCEAHTRRYRGLPGEPAPIPAP